jgi:hypothetical protein
VLAPSTVRIVYEATSASPVGPSWWAALPALAAPQLPEFLRPPRGWRSACFDVTYLDASMRVTVRARRRLARARGRKRRSFRCRPACGRGARAS